MLFDQPLTLLLGSFAAAGLLELLILKFAKRWHLLATPSARSSHNIPSPTGGGLAIVLIVLLAMLPYTASPLVQSLCYGGAILAITGLWDDIRELGVGIRLIIQLIAVSAVVINLGPSFSLLCLGPAVFLILWHVNLFNFMDGIDGIAAVQVLLFCLGALILATETSEWIEATLWVTAGSTAGFLLFNWPPARIFIGDVGSLFLGLLLAVIALELSLTKALAPAASLILLSAFLMDATYTLIIRMATGQNPFQSHRSHLYQQPAAREKTRTSSNHHRIHRLRPVLAVSAGNGSRVPARAVRDCVGWRRGPHTRAFRLDARRAYRAPSRRTCTLLNQDEAASMSTPISCVVPITSQNNRGSR